MRGIKFRVIVHYAHGQIDIFDDTCGDWRLEFNEGYEAQLLLWDYEREGWRRHDGSFTVLLFTGLYDRKGKEIYDGDVLDGSYVNPMSQETVRRHYKVTFQKGNHYAELIGHHPYGTTMLYFENEKSEVIGNIYENPELLES